MARRRPNNAVEPAQIDTPFENLLYTNLVPGERDCQRIMELIVAPMKEAQDLTTEIARLQDIVEKLTAKRDGLTEFVESHLAFVSPVRKLPHDILGEIFVACLPTDRYPILHQRDSPLLLSHICSDWRSVALSTPRLWEALHITTP
ncbi:hypothetical protein C8R43DRAFT_935280, partial [Mycena crocata]